MYELKLGVPCKTLVFVTFTAPLNDFGISDWADIKPLVEQSSKTSEALSKNFCFMIFYKY